METGYDSQICESEFGKIKASISARRAANEKVEAQIEALGEMKNVLVSEVKAGLDEEDNEKKIALIEKICMERKMLQIASIVEDKAILEIEGELLVARGETLLKKQTALQEKLKAWGEKARACIESVDATLDWKELLDEDDALRAEAYALDNEVVADQKVEKEREEAIALYMAKKLRFRHEYGVSFQDLQVGTIRMTEKCDLPS